jgi:Tfp pilus assembly protein FimT
MKLGPLRRRSSQFSDRSCGLTLVELIVAIAISMVIAGMVVINAQSITRSIRLSESATNYANLLQQARIRAVQDDRYYTILTTTGTTSSPPTAFVDIAGSGTYATNDPMTVMATGVTASGSSSGPNITGLKSQFLPAGASAQGSLNTTAAGPTFGPRGLPCTPATSAGYTTCPFLTPTSYVTFFQNSQSQKWAAVTVTPAGRIRQWSYDGSNWSPVN